MLESADLLATDDGQPATSLVHVTETLVDQRDKEVDKDVHAQYVPGDEKSARPFRATTVTFKVPISYRAKGFVDVGEIFHKLIPPFTHTHRVEEDEGFRDSPKVDIPRFIGAKSSEAKGLCQGNGIHKKQHEPRSKKVRNGSQTCSCGLEKLVELVVARNEEEGDGDKAELVQLDKDSHIVFCQYEDRSDKCPRYSENGKDIPGALPESVP